MPTDAFVFQVKQIRQVAHLKRISCRQGDRESTMFQFRDDGRKERNMGRIVEVDPDLRL